MRLAQSDLITQYLHTVYDVTQKRPLAGTPSNFTATYSVAGRQTCRRNMCYYVLIF